VGGTWAEDWSAELGSLREELSAIPSAVPSDYRHFVKLRFKVNQELIAMDCLSHVAVMQKEHTLSMTESARKDKNQLHDM
jgi:hypothetical protein